MNATKLAWVKDWMGEGDLGPGVDGQLNQLIPAVSRAIEGHQILNRSLLKAERFEVLPAFAARNKRFTLREAPVDLTATFKVLESNVHDWTVTEQYLRGTDYVVHAGIHAGWIEFLTDYYIPGPTSVRVQYTAGLALTEDALLSDYPAIVQAANFWVAEAFRRRETMTSTIEKSGHSGPTTTYQAGLMHGSHIKAVRGMLHDYIRRGVV